MKRRWRIRTFWETKKGKREFGEILEKIKENFLLEESKERRRQNNIHQWVHFFSLHQSLSNSLDRQQAELERSLYYFPLRNGKLTIVLFLNFKMKIKRKKFPNTAGLRSSFFNLPETNKGQNLQDQENISSER